jgi:hypothetical protein
MSGKIASLEDEKRRKEELAAFCRHSSAVLEMLRYSLDQLNPASRAQALAHVCRELKKHFEL